MFPSWKFPSWCFVVNYNILEWILMCPSYTRQMTIRRAHTILCFQVGKCVSKWYFQRFWTLPKAPIPEPIEKIVDKFKPPDDFDDALLEDAQIRNSESATQDTWAYQSFLYETFVQTTVNDIEAEHTEGEGFTLDGSKIALAI